MIKNIIFDLGNVLVPIDTDRPRKALLNILRNPLINAPKLMKLVTRYEVGEISTSLFINGILRISKTDTQALDVIRAWNSVFLDIPAHSLDLLRSMRENYAVFILSNTNELHIEYVNKELDKKFNVKDLNDLVDKAYYSHDMKLSKPDLKIYKNLLAAESILPEESLFIDDLKENVQAAESIGLHTIHLDKIEERDKRIEAYLRNQADI